MYKKIALSFLIITIVVLAIAIYVFNKNKERELYNDYHQSKEQDINNQKIVDEKQDNNQKINKKSEGRTKEQLEKEIELRITIKGSKIAEESHGRNYTDDEIGFIDNPRLNIIKIMEASGEITKEELKLLE